MKVLPVVVLYKTSLKNCESVNSLRFQNSNYFKIDKLFVYDNSPDDSINSDLSLTCDDLDVIYVHDVDNSGVSKAYNTASTYAAENGYDWLLLLDQDTILPDNAFEKYHAAMSSHSELPIFAPILKTKKDIICSPCKFKYHRGFTPKEVPTGIVSFKNYAPINSCMMVSTQKLIEVGGYNERAFLDFSDFQFIERLKKKYSDFFVVDFIALQDFSNDTTNINSLINRFDIYCSCARACEREDILDDLQYAIIVLLRMIKLSLRTKSIIFFKMFLTRYVFK